MATKGKWLILCLFALVLTYGVSGLGIVGSAQEERPTPAAEEIRLAAVDRSTIIRDILTSSVKILLGSEQAGGKVSEIQSSSGVVIYSEEEPKPWSLILTNAHAVNLKGLSEKPRIYMSYVTPTGRRLLRAEVVAQGSQDSIDLALVRVEGVSLPAVRFQEMNRVQLGSPVLVSSSPFGRELSITSGIISQLYLSGPPAIEQACATESRQPCLEPKPLEEIFKTDAPICYGSSGGGVFLAATGKLVGLVESYQTADIIIRPKGAEEFKIQIPVPGESYLISVNKIKYFLVQHGLDLNGQGVLLTAKQD